jgi:hypothetical protein
MAGCGPQTAALKPKAPLLVRLLYSTETSSLQMGQTLKTIVEVQDERGDAVKDAAVSLGLRDPAGAI